MASAVFSGSFGSGLAGFLFVLTEQNLQPLVHVSPRSMMVAVASDFLPPQHSPIFGHLASSQTVASFNSLTSFFNLWKDCPFGIGTFNQDGRRAFGSCLAASNGSTTFSAALPLKKSLNDGPWFNESLKIVRDLFFGAVVLFLESSELDVFGSLVIDARVLMEVLNTGRATDVFLRRSLCESILV
ncbi:hypothetical protein WICPIJ_005449 [Wickerhamomyces pijperi]|uniref:Uncharacterized protein n=1 Tax=Wickerhamomyces pijperi TaxID=599730 RepID=A0A9P8Q433_WICPI|nr:hypothetical protein WICPIJ_005449 [Wickerhamomyces pijperi]